MRRTSFRLAAPTLLLAATACLAPGTELVPAPGDFAFLEIKLQG